MVVCKFFIVCRIMVVFKKNISAISVLTSSSKVLSSYLFTKSCLESPHSFMSLLMLISICLFFSLPLCPWLISEPFVKYFLSALSSARHCSRWCKKSVVRKTAWSLLFWALMTVELRSQWNCPAWQEIEVGKKKDPILFSIFLFIMEYYTYRQKCQLTIYIL